MELYKHKTNTANDNLKIEVVDLPGSGGAHHQYKISGYSRKQPVEINSVINGADVIELSVIDNTFTDINFQDGPIKEAGVNGLTQESLLAVVIHRLECFQAGPFACKENGFALQHCEEALHWLQQRTLDRVRRNVEGVYQK